VIGGREMRVELLNGLAAELAEVAEKTLKKWFVLFCKHLRKQIIVYIFVLNNFYELFERQSILFLNSIPYLTSFLGWALDAISIPFHKYVVESQ
jgi:hypothetical protein